jgi:hypothetical protein
MTSVSAPPEAEPQNAATAGKYIASILAPFPIWTWHTLNTRM